MSTPAELSLSITFKCAQRALDQWLEPGAVHEAAFGLRGLLQAVDAAETSRLSRWLRWRSYAARANHNLALLARIEKIQAVFGGKLGASSRTLSSRDDRPGLGARKPKPRLAQGA